MPPALNTLACIHLFVHFWTAHTVNNESATGVVVELTSTILKFGFVFFVPLPVCLLLWHF